MLLKKMGGTLEWEREQRLQKKTKIMRMRFPMDVIPELIEKGIGGFDCDYILNHKGKINETGGRTQNHSNGGTQS